MLIVTGGAGFLGSAVIWKFNEMGFDNILVVDNLGTSEKWRNLVNRRFAEYLHKDEFLERIRREKNHFGASAVVHMGACSSTTELDAGYLMENNTHFTMELARDCLESDIRLVNASSAATYGDGSQGFADDAAQLERLKPMNMYGYSKHLFDLAAKRQGFLGNIASLKFFNVFGPNEYHKGEMRSVACKAFGQIKKTGKVRLFKSHRPDYADGGQLRDFVYVKDCAAVVAWLVEHPEACGLFNVGSGKARSFLDLVRPVFAALGLPESIEYVDMPEAIRDTYQYYTEAPMDRLRKVGYDREFTPLETAVGDYAVNYLAGGDRYL